jgi:hypothetical protein
MTASGVRMGEAIGTAGDEQGAERQRRGIDDRSEGRERKVGGLLLGMRAPAWNKGYLGGPGGDPEVLPSN